MYVLDSSAILAVTGNESGAEVVIPVIRRSVISCVNYLECLRKIVEAGMPAAEASLMLEEMEIEVIDYTIVQADLAASMVREAKHKGISLGDLACLSLAKHMKLPVLTADKTWAKLKVGVKVKLIR